MGVIARHRSMEDWSVSLGNTLLASIVCLLWYVFGLWEEKDKVSEEASLTSAEKKVRSVDKEENFNNGSGHLCTSRTGGEGHLYMLPEEGRHLLVEQAKQRQEEIQSTMQLKEEKAPIAPEEKKTTTTKSLDVRNQGPPTFQWPQNANVLESARPTTSTALSSALEDKLKDLGIFRSDSDGSKSQVEGAARRCGLELTRKQVRVSFDTFMAKSRPGLESDEEVKESPKPKRKQGNKKNNNVKEKKTVESVSRYEKKERKEKKEKGTMIRTGGWSNPAWKMVQPQPSPALVRAF